MKPLAAGAIAGAAAGALLLLPALSTASRMRAARAERAAARAEMAAPVARPPLARSVMPGSGAALAARVRQLGKAGGVLIEQAAVAPSAGGLAVVRFRASGAEKAVLALADTLERERPIVRLARWRIEALPGGAVRLEAEAIAP